MGIRCRASRENLTTASTSVKRSLGETGEILVASPRHHLYRQWVLFGAVSQRGADLFTTRLREGSWNDRECAGRSIKGFIENPERFIEEICCTAQSDMNLFESFLPSSLLVEGLETAMLFIHDRLLRI